MPCAVLEWPLQSMQIEALRPRAPGEVKFLNFLTAGSSSVLQPCRWQTYMHTRNTYIQQLYTLLLLAEDAPDKPQHTNVHVCVLAGTMATSVTSASAIEAALRSELEAYKVNTGCNVTWERLCAQD